MGKMFKIKDLTGKCGHVVKQASIFMPYAHKKLGFNKPVGVNFISDHENAKNPLGKTAYYDPNSMQITIFVDKRHVKDILRSLSHELIHHTQNCRGEFDKHHETGDNYAQKDPHMRKMEAEAYLLGNGLLFRDWEDSIKENLTMKKNKNINEADFFSGDREIVLDPKFDLRRFLPSKQEMEDHIKKLEQEKELEREREFERKKADRLKKAEDDARMMDPKSSFATDFLDAYGLEENNAMSRINEEPKPDFPDVDADGNRTEPISKAQKDKKEKESRGGAEKKKKKKKDLSKVPPQLRATMKGGEGEDETVDEAHCGSGKRDDDEKKDKELEESVFAPNHYCVHHGGVYLEGEVRLGKVLRHNWNEALQKVTKYDMQFEDGTIVENVKAEDILVTEASLAKEHGGDGEKHSPMKRDDDEKKKKKKKVLVDDDDKKNENWTRGNKNDLLFERLTKMWTK